MITVLTVLFHGVETEHALPVYSRDRYGPHWVDRLYRGVRRNLSQPFRMVCLVDKPYTFAEPVDQVELLDPSEGWMAINEAFRPDLGVERGLLMGLDTVITGSLDEIAAHRASLLAPRDPFQTRVPCNALVSFDARGADYMWSEWNADRPGWRARCMYAGSPSEMVFLRKLWPRADFEYLDDHFAGQVVSYKCHVKGRERGDERVVYFHGSPKPCDLPENDWVRLEWEAA